MIENLTLLRKTFSPFSAGEKAAGFKPTTLGSLVQGTLTEGKVLV
jgi:hypothetical protein